MFFHRRSYKKSCFSELAYNSSVLVLIRWSAAWNSRKKLSLKCCSEFWAFGFEVIPHPSCYLTSVMDKIHHWPVIAFFLCNSSSFFSLRRGCPTNHPFWLFSKLQHTRAFAVLFFICNDLLNYLRSLGTMAIATESS